MNTAFQKVYTKITQITKATCSLKAQGVGNDELAIVNGRLAQVVKIWGDDITLQVFSGTEGIPKFCFLCLMFDFILLLTILRHLSD